MHETPFFLMFGRQPRLPVDIILGIPHVGRTADTEEFAQNTRDNLQIAFELTRRNLTERADKQAEQNSKLEPYRVQTWAGSTRVQTIPGLGWSQPKTATTVARPIRRLLSIITGGV